ncbi:MAG: hypothetical protein LBR32_09500 [Propionibacteriaceae bacterium]|nr:hypothetical protein [Propionibacteriaceae bacterium]
MSLFCIAASHRDLPLAALDRISAAGPATGSQVIEACPPVRGAVTLATCNRFELYMDVDVPLGTGSLEHARIATASVVAQAAGLDPDETLGAFAARTDLEAVAHLFAVAAGLESMVPGDAEIAGQVRRAADEARARHATTKPLELAFQHALRTANVVGSRAGLAGLGRSIVQVALALACARVNGDTAVAGRRPDITPLNGDLVSLRGRRVLLLGTGSYAGVCVAALRRLNAAAISVHSTSGRAPGFAASHGVEAVGPGHVALVEAVGSSDLVMSVSGVRGRDAAASYLLDVETLLAARPVPAHVRNDAASPSEVSDEALSAVGRQLPAEAVVGVDRHPAATQPLAGQPQRFVRPLTIIDLAMPHDIDPAVASLPGVSLIGLDEVQRHSPDRDAARLAAAQELVDQAVTEYAELTAGRAFDCQIAAMVGQAEELIRDEIAAAHQAITKEARAVDGADPSVGQMTAVAKEIRHRHRAALHHAIVQLKKAAAQPVAAE